MDVRVAAARAIVEVIVEGQSLSMVMPRWQARVEAKDAALLQEMVYGVLRWRWRLEFFVKQLLQNPLKERDADVQALLLLGVYQLEYMRVPAHASVSATVSATALLKKEWARGLMNAVLRNYQRQREALQAKVEGNSGARYAHPAWLLKMLQTAYPEHWQAIADANNQRPPMVLRVNRRKNSRAEYLASLQQAGVDATPCVHSEDGVVLAKPVDVQRLPGFNEGGVSVQDEAAQLAALLLNAQPGERILDACAAPGGKTAHILECQPAVGEVVALDNDGGRLQRVGQSLERLGLAATLVTGDTAAPDTWWDGLRFDRILIDAPCSATGVIRRHPDIKSLRKADDIAALAQIQSRILDALWPLLKSGGMLLYATCSVAPAEGWQQVQDFLARHDDASEQLLDVTWGARVAVGRQILPGEGGMDGFYYACLRKR
ncbi:MAG: 16S rRNA (cytosine(967)-C(5))-methyltransferase RsmB [Gammaproteobacteria bacterium]|nr:16S rRNA (cytosine(967)-C(5))-methyltransferase RsmB [Gammaproteobacteria bacterium]